MRARVLGFRSFGLGGQNLGLRIWDVGPAFWIRIRAAHGGLYSQGATGHVTIRKIPCDTLNSSCNNIKVWTVSESPCETVQQQVREPKKKKGKRVLLGNLV